MKTVLLPTDFSEASRKAVRYALHLFQDQEVKYILLHVYDLPSHPIDIELAGLRNRFAEKPKMLLHREFISLIEETHQRSAKFEVSAEFGDEVKTILRYATVHQADYVVLGLPGCTPGVKWRSNRVDSIIRKAPCPVIVVPGKARCRKPGKMLLTMKANTKVADDRLSPLHYLVKAFQAKMEVVRVPHRNAAVSSAARKTSLFNSLRKEAVSLVTPLRSAGLVDSLGDFLTGLETDLLVVPQTRDTLADSLFRRNLVRHLAARTKVPVLTIPA